MNKELLNIKNAFSEIMKKTEGILGAWDFGSASHGNEDEYSDVDIIFLVKGDNFKSTEANLEKLLLQFCDEILLCWEEDFNSEAIVNNGYLIKKDEQILQFDIFLLNNDRIDDFMCKVHYTDLSEKDIIFDVDGSVLSLCKNCPHGYLWNDNLKRVFQTYVYHFHMTAKYLLRNDYFKLNKVMRTLFDTHASLLLTAFDQINWGGVENKLNFIPKEKQEHLKNYYCTGDFELNRNNLLKSVDMFEKDFAEITLKKNIIINTKILTQVKNHFCILTEK